jgi:very-short-patch-repair endonuclease
MAAVLACGAGAVLSHRDAAALLGLRPTARASVDVTAPRRRGRSITGIDVHSGATLAPVDVTCLEGVPCTSVARTLLDLAEVVDRRALERACDQAEMLRLFHLRTIEDVLERAEGRRGAAALRAVLAEHAGATTLTRSELEERFLALWRSTLLPAPEVNAWIALEGGGVEADFLWRERRLIVETDGRTSHMTARAFERDRRRDQRLMLAGWRVVRFTWRQVVDEPAVVEATIHGLLRATTASAETVRA